MKRYCLARGGAGRSLVRSPVMRYGRYGNAAPCHTHTGITARPSIEQPATSLRQHAGERAVELSHIERRGERPHALHTCAAGDTEETEMLGWLVAWLLAWLLAAAVGLLACFLACVTVPRTRFSDVHPCVQIGQVLFTWRFVLLLRKK